VAVMGFPGAAFQGRRRPALFGIVNRVLQSWTGDRPALVTGSS